MPQQIAGLHLRHYSFLQVVKLATQKAVAVAVADADITEEIKLIESSGLIKS